MITKNTKKAFGVFLLLLALLFVHSVTQVWITQCLKARKNNPADVAEYLAPCDSIRIGPCNYIHLYSKGKEIIIPVKKPL